MDLKSPTIKRVDMLEAKIDELLRCVSADRLFICPSSGFGRRNPDLAIGKTKAMLQAVREVNQHARGQR
jgi:methionine synthase II (cobalamin-independent)